MENPKILAIDDLTDNLIVLEALLSETFPKAQILTAQSGASGIKMCIAERPDVILLDIIMPGMDGFDVCRYLKSNPDTRIIPVIMVTASKTNTNFKVKALDAGADAFLTKPFEESELTAQIRAMLRIKEAEDLRLGEKQHLRKLVEERTFALQNELNERKIAEEALKTSESQFREFFEKAADAIFVAEIDSGIILDANEAATRLIGKRYSQLIGIHQSQLHPPVKEDYAGGIFTKHKEQVGQGLTSVAIEDTVLRADGTKIPVEIVASEVNYHGKQCMMGTFRDITERKKAEGSIRLSEERLRLISDSSNDIICSYDLQSRFTSANQTLCEAMQLREYQIVGKTHEELHFPEAQCREWAGLHRQVLDSGHTIYSESVTPMPDGSFHFYEIALNPLHDAGQKIIGIGAVIRDITERKKAEEALRESQQLFKGLFNASPDAIVLIDPYHPTISWPIVDCNEAACQMNGYTREEMIGQSIDLVNISPGNNDERLSYLNELRKEPIVNRESLHRKKDGRAFPVEISTSLVTIGSRELILGIDRDITERKQAEASLNESNEFNNSLVKTIPFGMHIVDYEGNILFQSENFSQIFGEKALGCKCWDLYRDEKTQCVNCPLKNGIDIGQTQTYESSGVLGGRVFEISHTGMMFNGKKAMLEIFHDITERKQVEDELIQKEYFIKSIAENSPSIIFLYDVQLGRNTYTNRSISKLLGYSEDELTDDSPDFFLKKIHPDDLLQFKDFYINIDNWSEDQIFEYEYRILSKSGSWVWFQGSEKEFQRENGKVISMIGTVQDITERKQAEAELRLQKQRLMGVLEGTNAGTWNWNVQTGEEIHNQRWAEIIGYQPEELDTDGFRVWESTVHPDDLPNCRDQLNKLINNEIEFYNVEFRQLHKNGEWVWVHSRGKVVERDKDGNIVWISGTHIDITDRKKAEIELQQSQSTLRGILDSFPGEIFWKDIDLNYLGCNKAFSVSAHLQSSDEIIGKTDFELPWANSGAELYRSMDRQVINTRIPFHNLIASQIEADGKLVWLNTSKLPLTDLEGKVIGIMGVSHDITDFKLAEQSLLASMELNSSLLHTIPFGMDIVDELGNVLFQNEKLEELFGKNAVGKKCWDLYRDDQTQCGECPLLTGIQIGHTNTIETRNALGGKIFQISHTGMMFQGKEAMLEIFQDVTEKRKAEKELEEINQRFSNLVETTDGIVWEADAETFLFSFVSKNAERLLGYHEQEWYQPNFWSEHIYPEDWEKTVNFCVTQTKLSSDHDFEYRFVSKDGRVLWLADYVKVIVRNGKPWKLNGLMVDITERKKMELALHESENRYRSFISQVTEGVCRFESDRPMDITLPLEEQVDFIYDHFFIAECNDAILKMYKLSGENEMIGKRHLDFHGGRDNPVNRELIREFVRNGYSIVNGLTIEYDAAGQQRFISNNSIGIVENDRLVRTWGTETDITEKVRADQVQQVLYSISNAAHTTIDLSELIEIISKEIGKLIASTNFYIAFYDEKTNMLSTVYENDEKDKLQTWPAEKSITGYVIKQQKSLLIREPEILQLIESGEIESFGTLAKVWMGVPLTINKKAIGALCVQNYENPDAYSEQDKQILEFISNQICVSIQRKRDEQELKLMGKAIHQSPVTIVITDREGVIEYTNPKFTETTGYSAEEAKGKTPRILKSGKQSKAYYRNLWKTILAGEDWFGEFQNLRKNGEIYWESAVISAITNEKGDIVSFMAIKEDITDKKKMIDDLVFARNKAEESDRLKSTFLANMSHEIRTPLNSIIGFSELMRDPDFDDSQRLDFSRMINDSGNNLLVIITDIMDLSKIEAGMVQVRKETVYVNQLVYDLHKEYSFMASNKGVALQLDDSALLEPIVIESDESMLRKILINFIGNAIKFTKEGFIEMGVKRVGGFLQFQVKDTGIGIPVEFHSTIFERFRQVESFNTRKYGGNGLGLAISKSLAELLGGKIGMESAPGVGSTFYFTVPI